MEECVKNRNYLNHLKQISAIKNGHYKSSIPLTNSKASQLNLNDFAENISNLTHTSSKFGISNRTCPLATNRVRSTEQINLFQDGKNINGFETSVPSRLVSQKNYSCVVQATIYFKCFFPVRRYNFFLFLRQFFCLVPCFGFH